MTSGKALLFLSFFISAQSFAQDISSAVYSCRFTNDMTGLSSIRMKDYFDTAQNMRLGKVDFLQNSVVIESTPTKVYQIPMTDNKTYVQIWNSTLLRVEAHLSYASSREFSATYVKNSERQGLVCTLLRD